MIWPRAGAPRIDDAAWRDARARCPMLDALEPDEAERVRALAGEFIARKSFEGAGGLEVEPWMAISIAADRLYDELPKPLRRDLADLPATIERLEEDAKAMRRQVEELDGVLSRLGDAREGIGADDERASLRQRLERTRDEAKGRMTDAISALCVMPRYSTSIGTLSCDMATASQPRMLSCNACSVSAVCSGSKRDCCTNVSAIVRNQRSYRSSMPHSSTTTLRSSCA